ncbi:MAG: response regulator [Gammaproteobacteria bacterium]|uniref:Response regulator n=1 Tax=Candidatus Thiopontia autotrophica TaxID=2841688 RepID=A0A8J6P9E8_9GAMM|nr:response regulator [Candidatus Thiopontia autotrophica]MBL6969178.1 response regulator [Gammaproteobacteria bacterium]
MGEKNKILIVDDDQKLRDLLSRYLNEQGYEVETAEDGEEMDSVLPGFSPNLIVLDLMMPGEDGLSIARRLRASSNIPIIILSAKGEEIDKIVGLEMGADDYLAKPFNPRELLARIQSVLRRLDRADAGAEDQNTVSFGDYQVDLNSYSLTKNGEAVEVTSGEFELLRHLVEHPNHVLSRDHLLDLLDGGSEEAFDRSIDVRITRLRKKIEADPHHPVFIKTVRGVGYIFSTSS